MQISITHKHNEYALNNSKVKINFSKKERKKIEILKGKYKTRSYKLCTHKTRGYTGTLH